MKLKSYKKVCAFCFLYADSICIKLKKMSDVAVPKLFFILWIVTVTSVFSATAVV